MSKTDITVIMPIFNLDETSFKNAITSIENQLVKPDEIILVVGKESSDIKLIEKSLEELKVKLTYRTIINDGDTGFQSQMNFGVSKCETIWFTYLEQDDELSSIWLKNVVKYREVYDDVTVFLPLVIDVTEGTKEVPSDIVGLTNEAVWAAEFSDEMGILDNGALIKHQNFSFDGMVMMKEVYEEFGGIKTNIKLTFMYEFLLRITNESVRVMVVPKIGYKHVNMRTGGLFETLKDELTPDEARWWLATARREYFHIEDRNVKYEKLIA
jgi:glycosyltransferase involved in cell wall biosynthesis